MKQLKCGGDENELIIFPSVPNIMFYIMRRQSVVLSYYIINLVVRRLNAYVGKERIHCFLVVRPVVTVVRGNRDPK